jgi:hexosaminidase
MKKIIFLLSVHCLLLSVPKAQDIVSIIPQPSSLQKTGSSFILDDNVLLLPAVSLGNEVKYLQEALRSEFGLSLSVPKKNIPGRKNIHLLLHGAIDNREGYRLEINATGIRITGGSAAGVFRGIQTLLQLVPAGKKAPYTLTGMEVNDAPRFFYRGMHLDVGRHFFPVSFIKKYIDYLARYKYNNFHWHLTEDQGWRIEIKKYPLLTSKGGCREGTIIGRYPGTGNDNQKYCGYYTQAQIKEVVRYATQRHINIVPEIEMPGHSSAALTAYPELGCTGGPYKVQQTWGVFEEVFCAGNDKTFSFLQDVIDEVVALFPSPYIHIGGDECPKESWKKCTGCQQRIKAQGLKDEHELQSYFIQRMEKYINSKGRNIIGWDEILEGGLAPNATVMSWRGEEGGIEAAKQKHTVIMTPGSHCYFDHSQTRNEDSVTIGGYTTVEKVYSYEPIPAVLNEEQSKYVLGAQGNVWTEYMKYPSKVEYMIFPRLLALSEVLWSSKTKRNWKDFEPRLLQHLGRLKQKGVNFSTAYFDPGVEIRRTKEPGSVKVILKPRKKEGFIRDVIYKLEDDLTYVPGEEFLKLMLTLDQDGEAGITIYKSGRHAFQWIAGKDSSREVMLRFDFNKATARDIRVTEPPSKRYSGEDSINGLVNGLRSQKGIASPEWLGWEGGNLETIIDLGSEQEISKVTIHTLDQNGSWIYLPSGMEVALSNDGQQFNTVSNNGALTDDKNRMKWITASFSPAQARYVKILVKNFGLIPSGNPGAGHKAWLFVDEVGIW